MTHEVKLEVQDLVVLARAVDLAAMRGAYKAVEMADVGTAYKRAMEEVARVTKALKEKKE